MEVKEALPFSPALLPGVTKEALVSAFHAIDLDGNAHVGASELRHLLTVLGENPLDEEIDEMIRMVDLDGIGQVGREEWMRTFEQKGVVMEMRNIKHASNKVKRELEALASAGIENVAAAHVAQNLRQKDAKENRAKRIEKEDRFDAERNYNILRQFGVAPNQLKKYYERFLEVDKEESGSISYDEFCLVLEEDDTELIRSLFDIFDLDGSGTVEMIEFIVGLSAYCTSTTKEERMKFAFMICDTENTGFLDRENIGKILKANFLAQQSTSQDVNRRVDKIFRLANAKDRISCEQLLNVAKRVSGLVYPAYAMMEDAAINKD